MPRTATVKQVTREQLLDFLRPRHHALLLTRRNGGEPQLSPVSAGVDLQGRVVIATYPQRAKVINARRVARVSLCVLSDDFDGAWVQVDGEYRAAMIRQGKSLLRVTIERWGPVATGGFPPRLAL